MIWYTHFVVERVQVGKRGVARLKFVNVLDIKILLYIFFFINVLNVLGSFTRHGKKVFFFTQQSTSAKINLHKEFFF